MNRQSTSLLAAISLSLFGAAGPATAQDHAAHATSTPPPWSQADRYYGAEAMARARQAVQHNAGGQSEWLAMLERLEMQRRDGQNALVWDGKAYVGTDINKLYLKSEGHFSFEEDTFEEAELQALWSHAISPYWDLQTGLRYDFEPEGLTQGVFGFQGMAPYFIEMDTAVFISENGDVSARAKAEYDLFFTQRLILQPRVELDVSFQNVPKRDIGNGVSNLEAGLRLRYEIEREFAPYFGVAWQGAFGATADFIEAAGGKSKGIAAMVGVRAWF